MSMYDIGGHIEMKPTRPEEIASIRKEHAEELEWAQAKIARLTRPVSESEIDAALATHVDKTNHKWIDDRLTVAQMVRSIFENRILKETPDV